MHYRRKLDLEAILDKKSVLLLGPRSTGKSFYIRNQLANYHYINLLKSSDFLLLSAAPDELENIVKQHSDKFIVIDEIQKIPILLDEVHRLIEECGTIFLLTGSSARKLRSHGVNLLAGRAWLASMFPFNFGEIVENEGKFDLSKMIQFGALPHVWTSTDPLEELDSYVQTYIEMEIKAEGIIRKIPAFSRFLKAAALHSGELLNYQNISSDAGVPVSTVKEHYQVLEDTLVGFTLEPWTESKKRKAIATGKFYFFDIGVLNFISDITPQSENSTEWGSRFEHFIVNEIRCANAYMRKKAKIYFWRSTAGHEVDIIFGEVAIEIKSTKKVVGKHLKGLRALREESKFSRYILVSRDKQSRKLDGFDCLYFEDFLRELWSEGSLKRSSDTL